MDETAKTASPGERLSELREQSGMSAAELAEAADVEEELINGLECGEAEMTVGIAAKLALVLGVPVSVLTIGLYDGKKD